MFIVELNRTNPHDCFGVVSLCNEINMHLMKFCNEIILFGFVCASVGVMLYVMLEGQIPL